MEKKTMKKSKIIISLGLASCIGLVACGGNKDSEDVLTSNETTVSQEAISSSEILVSSEQTSSSSVPNSKSSSASSSKSTSSSKPITKATVTYRAEGQADVVVQVDLGSYRLSVNIFQEPAGKEFKGWLVNGETKMPGDVIMLTGDIVITAIFGDIPYTVTEEEIITKAKNVCDTFYSYKGAFTCEKTVKYLEAGDSDESTTKYGADFASGRGYVVRPSNNYTKYFPRMKDDTRVDGMFVEYSYDFNSLSATSYTTDEDSFLETTNPYYHDDDLVTTIFPALNVYKFNRDLVNKYMSFCSAEMLKEMGQEMGNMVPGNNSFTSHIDVEDDDKYIIEATLIYEFNGEDGMKLIMTSSLSLLFDDEKFYDIDSIEDMSMVMAYGQDPVSVYSYENHITYTYTFNETQYTALAHDQSKVDATTTGVIKSYPVMFNGYKICTAQYYMGYELTYAQFIENFRTRFGLSNVKVKKVSWNDDLSNPFSDTVVIDKKANTPIYVDIEPVEGKALLITKATRYRYPEKQLMDNFSLEELALFGEGIRTEDYYQLYDVNAEANVPVRVNNFQYGTFDYSAKLNGETYNNSTFDASAGGIFYYDAVISSYGNEGGSEKEPFTLDNAVYQSNSKVIYNATDVATNLKYYYIDASKLKLTRDIKVYQSSEYIEYGHDIDLSKCVDVTMSQYSYRYDYLKSDGNWDFVTMYQGIPANYDGLVRIGLKKYNSSAPSFTYMVIE